MIWRRPCTNLAFACPRVSDPLAMRVSVGLGCLVAGGFRRGAQGRSRPLLAAAVPLAHWPARQLG
jgi:hypothetical protein